MTLNNKNKKNDQGKRAGLPVTVATTSGVSSASFELQKSGETLFSNQNSLDYNGRIMENVFSPDETHCD